MTMKATKVLRLLFFIGCVAFVVQGKSVKWKKDEIKTLRPKNEPGDEQKHNKLAPKVSDSSNADKTKPKDDEVAKNVKEVQKCTCEMPPDDSQKKTKFVKKCDSNQDSKMCQNDKKNCNCNQRNKMPKKVQVRRLQGQEG